MNVQTITMAKSEAKQHFREYQQAVRQTNRKEDVALMRGFKALGKGQTLIDVHAAMKFAGLNERHQPKLAICRADATHCWWKGWYDGASVFSMDNMSLWRWSAKVRRSVRFPKNTFGSTVFDSGKSHRAVVPSIPPRLRPKIAYSNLHILWEAEWETVPADPMLLRHLDGALYVVLAAWDLTELEKAVLKRAL